MFPEHRHHLLALPRLPLDGRYQEMRYLDVLLSGVPYRPVGRFSVASPVRGRPERSGPEHPANEQHHERKPGKPRGGKIGELRCPPRVDTTMDPSAIAARQ